MKLKLRNLYALLVLALANRPITLVANPGLGAPQTIAGKFQNALMPAITKHPNLMGMLGVATCVWGAKKSYALIAQAQKPLEQHLRENYQAFTYFMTDLAQEYKVDLSILSKPDHEEPLEQNVQKTHIGLEEISSCKALQLLLHEKLKTCPEQEKRKIMQHIMTLELVKKRCLDWQASVGMGQGALQWIASGYEYYQLYGLLRGGWDCINAPFNAAQVAKKLYYNPLKLVAQTWALSKVKNFALNVLFGIPTYPEPENEQ